MSLEIIGSLSKDYLKRIILQAGHFYKKKIIISLLLSVKICLLKIIFPLNVNNIIKNRIKNLVNKIQ